MKKLTLLIVIVFSGTLLQSQTFTELSNSILGTEIRLYEDGKTREKTDFGTVLLKLKSKNNIVVRIVISISNDNQFYETIVETDTIAEIRVGSRWTDFTFYYEALGCVSFNDLASAKEYYNQYINSEVDVYKEIVIYKHIKKEKYLVGIIVPSKGTGFLTDDENGSCGSSYKYKLLE